MMKRPTRTAKRFLWNRWFLLLIIVIIGVSIWLMSPSGSSALHHESDDLGLRLGLDLKGGVQLVYQADFSKLTENLTDTQKADAVDGAIKSIESRVNGLGVVEPVIQKQGADRILVELPGITDVETAKSVIEATAFLEFREVERKPADSSTVTLNDYMSENFAAFFETSVPGSRIFYTSASQDPVAVFNVGDNGTRTLTDNSGNVLYQADEDGNILDDNLSALGSSDTAALSWEPATGTLNGVVTQLTGSYLTSAKRQVSTNSLGAVTYAVGIGWNSDGTTIFNQIAARLNAYYNATSVDSRSLLGIVLDGKLISSPQMEESASAGNDQITGNFDANSSQDLAVQLVSGALPVPLKTLFESQISATLGADFVRKAFVAGMVGLLIVALFMILYYRLPGVVATAALIIYTLIVLSIYKLIPVTLTLAGIAGFVVSMGMAVDANVLIFERMKEELRAGSTLKAAIDAGFSRAWPSIRDSNISTFITCIILYWFGSHIVASSTVKGFALTLFIGVAVSMFSAVVISRTLLLTFLSGSRATRNLNWFGVETKPAAGAEDD